MDMHFLSSIYVPLICISRQFLFCYRLLNLNFDGIT
jgi:hypothetical protein